MQGRRKEQRDEVIAALGGARLAGKRALVALWNYGLMALRDAAGVPTEVSPLSPRRRLHGGTPTDDERAAFLALVQTTATQTLGLAIYEALGHGVGREDVVALLSADPSDLSTGRPHVQDGKVVAWVEVLTPARARALLAAHDAEFAERLSQPPPEGHVWLVGFVGERLVLGNLKFDLTMHSIGTA